MAAWHRNIPLAKKSLFIYNNPMMNVRLYIYINLLGKPPLGRLFFCKSFWGDKC